MSAKNASNELDHRSQTVIPRPPHQRQLRCLGLLQRVFMLCQVMYSGDVSFFPRFRFTGAPGGLVAFSRSRSSLPSTALRERGMPNCAASARAISLAACRTHEINGQILKQMESTSAFSATKFAFAGNLDSFVSFFG